MNYTLDPALVFSEELGVQYRKCNKNIKHLKYFRPNLRYQRVQYILNNKDKYDSFIFGSSRASSIPISKLGSNWYRLNYPDGSLLDHYQNLRALLNKNYDVKNIIIALDGPISFNRIDMYSNFFRVPYPSTLYENFLFYKFYLIKKLNKYDYLLMSSNNFKLKKVVNEGIDSGVVDWEKYVWPKKELFSSKQHFNYMKGIRPHKTSMANININGIKYIKKIIKLCKDNNIKYTFFFNPLFFKTYLSMDIKNFCEIKRKIVEITPFYDFSGLSKESMNFELWQESAHFTSVIGNKILNRLNNKNRQFGVLVTKDNIEKHIEKQNDDIKKNFVYLYSKYPQIKPKEYILQMFEPKKQINVDEVP